MVSTIFFLPLAVRDVERAAYTVASIRKYCTGYRIYFLVDGFDPASLSHLEGPDTRIRCAAEVSKGHWGLIWQTLLHALIAANREPDVAPDAIFVKIDADALIIRKGFGERIRKIFSTRPAAGQIGQNFSNVNGARFSNTGWMNHLKKLTGVRGTWHLLRGAIRRGEGLRAGLEAHREYRAMMRRACDNGYVFGDFCMGGCFALRRELVARIADSPFAVRTPFRFLPALFDDVIMTTFIYSLGFAAIEDTADDGAFAIEGKKLRVDPFVLQKRGHYVIHPLKYGHQGHGHNLSEAELVYALMDGVHTEPTRSSGLQPVS